MTEWTPEKVVEMARELQAEVDAILPYPDPETGHSSGHSGSDTSAERAHRDDADGTTSRRQYEVLGYLDSAAEYGVTWAELVEGYPDLFPHHGSASGCLSNLHKGGRIARLTERRGRSKIYVLPEHVGDRLTEPYGGKRASIDNLRQFVDEREAHGWVTVDIADIKRFL